MRIHPEEDIEKAFKKYQWKCPSCGKKLQLSTTIFPQQIIECPDSYCGWWEFIEFEEV